LELKILEERPNPLLKRTEYRFEVGHATAATPTRDSVRAELAKVLKSPKDRIIVEKMNARFGTARSEGFAAAYQSADALNAVVREHILIRNGLKEKAVKALPGSAPAPEAPSKPAEVTKKETPAEAPKKEAAAEHPKKDAGAEHPKKESGAEHGKKESGADHAKKEPGPEHGKKEGHSDSPKKEGHAESGKKDSHPESGKKAAHAEPAKGA
jgi:small subunit ribosomal protein S24e